MTAVPSATLAGPFHHGLLGGWAWGEWPLDFLLCSACARAGKPLLCLRGRLQKAAGWLPLQEHLHVCLPFGCA